MRLILTVFLFSILLGGAIGLKHPQDCELEVRIPEKMQCLHSAAISAAYLGIEGQAVTLCNRIYSEASGNADSDLQIRGDLMRSNCFYDIAKITGNPAHCDGVRGADYDSKLSGGRVTQEQCIQHAESVARLAPENFYQNNPNSICTMMFVLPLFLFFTLIRCP
ncbi:hypothetical protein JXA56_03435 [Candidatus Micrarchaeota archaeon]|nr:hypothetical protein [Candidatus Micrarchaeota archaeon]